MELLVVLIAASMAAALFYLLFILLFLIRRLGNRTLWAMAMGLMRPVLRELYSYDLAEAANKVLQAQPDKIKLLPLGKPGWKDAAGAEELLAGLKKLGFSAAGAYGADILPGVKLLFLTNWRSGEAACVLEHPAAGLWADVYCAYPEHAGITVSSGPDPRLPPRMRRPGDVVEYMPGAAPAALYGRLQALRRPEEPLRLTADNIAAVFEEEWALSADWRTQHEFTPEEALAMKKGRAMPAEAVMRSRLFDVAGGALAIVNFFALVWFLFASRAYTPVGDGPWREALLWCAPAALVFAGAFAASIQASGPIMRLTGFFFMALIAYPFFWGSFYTGATWYNGARDTGAAVVNRAEVAAKKATGRRERDHYVSLVSWRRGRELEKLHVTREQYDGVVPGRTIAVVATRPGALGHEWISELEFLGN